MDVDQGGRTGNVAHQIIFEEPDGTTTPWRVPDGVETADDLRAAVHAARGRGKKMVWYVGDEADRLRTLILEAWPSGNAQDMGLTDAGMVVKYESARKVETTHARAVAMVAFHFFLAISRARGDQPEFEGIRAVIRDGADPMALVSLQIPAEADVPAHLVRDERPEQVKHLALVYLSPLGELTVDMRLFADPTGRSPWWRVSLAKHRGRPIPIAALALAYFSDGPRRVHGRELDGELIALKPDHGAAVVPAPAAGI